ncbi:isochorismatase [Pantoea sp. RIT-PI-b]|uniref:isochorismatase family protein n=1 Tax=unclassified Pantoea TaxID=2630326 RepID=UPI000270DA46|nr:MULTISPECIES: isochorismatase family protein [unclassified Pantoea]EJL86140.1 nicotinamidase-like amidase [Pantoea sp. GM01]KNC13891.1 isochorismatase [Pantoea sp. RIT-PI-b]
MANRVVVVVDMQNGVLATPRFDRAGRCERINQLTAAADQVIFIQHVGPGLEANSAGWAIVPELHQPANAIFVNKTACDSFWQTDLAAHLDQLEIKSFVICGCATDYCVDTTIKVGASLGYHITVAADAHTTADRTYASAQQQINQHNEVWADLIMPGNPVLVRETEALLREWRPH